MPIKNNESKLVLSINAEKVAGNAVSLLYLYAMISGAPNVFITLKIGFQIMRILYLLIAAHCMLLVFLKAGQDRGRGRFLWLLMLVPLAYSCVWKDLNITGTGTNILVMLPCVILLVKSANIDFSSIYRAAIFWSAVCLLASLLARALPEAYIKLVAARYREYPSIYSNMAGRALNGRIVSLYSNNAGLCASVIPAMGASFFLGYFGQRRRKTILLYGLLIIICIVFTGKRGPLAFSLFSLLLTFYVCTNTKAKIFKWFFALLLVFSVLSVIIALSDSIQNSDWYVKFSETIKGIESGKDITNSRTILWRYALKSYKGNELFGVGWNQLVKHVPYTDNSGYRLATHNVYIQLLAETGLAGLILFLLPMAASLVRTWRRAAASRLPENAGKEERAAAAFALFSQLYFLLYCISGNPLYDSIFCIPYLISCLPAQSVPGMRGAVIEQV